MARRRCTAPTDGGDRARWAAPSASPGRPAGRLLLAALLGAGAIAADIGLIGTAAWLISRAAQHPNESHLAVAIVGVQFFGLSRGFFRYEERLVGHDAAFRLLADLRVQGLPAARAAGARRPARLSAGRPAGPDRPGCRLVAGPGHPGHPTVRHRRAGRVADRGAHVVDASGRRGSILAVALVLAGTVGALAHRASWPGAGSRGSRACGATWRRPWSTSPKARRSWSPSVPWRPSSRTIREQDAELTAIAAASAGTAGVGLGPDHPAGRAGLLGLPAGRHPGGDCPAGSTRTELAVITLIPLAAFELVVGLPVATQALQRVRQAAARVFEVTDAAGPRHRARRSRRHSPTAPTTCEARSVWARLPRSAGTGAPGSRPLPCPRPRVAVVGPSGAGKSTLAAVLAAVPALRRPVRSPWTASLSTGWPATTCAPSWVWSARTPTSSTPPSPRTCAIGRREATDAELRDVLDRVGLAGWLGGSAPGPGHRGRRARRPPVGRPAPADGGGPRPARRLPGPACSTSRPSTSTRRRPTRSPPICWTVTDDRSLVLITHRLAGLEVGRRDPGDGRGPGGRAGHPRRTARPDGGTPACGGRR